MVCEHSTHKWEIQWNSGRITFRHRYEGPLLETTITELKTNSSDMRNSWTKKKKKRTELTVTDKTLIPSIFKLLIFHFIGHRVVDELLCARRLFKTRRNIQKQFIQNPKCVLCVWKYLDWLFKILHSSGFLNKRWQGITQTKPPSKTTTKPSFVFLSQMRFSNREQPVGATTLNQTKLPTLQ